MRSLGCLLFLALITLQAAFGQSAPPAITGQPASITANAGQSVTLSLTATGSPTPTIQWLKDGKEITGATNSSQTFASVFGGDAGSYTATVSNVYNGSTYTLTTTPAVLTVITTPPTIVTQPVSQTVVAGGNVTFSVAATGSEPMLYRWYRDGVEINGATNSSLTIAGVQPNDAGSYRVSVVNWANQVQGISTGFSHTMFVVNNELWGMGTNEKGCLGDGSINNRKTPVKVAAGVQKVAAGGAHTMFIKADQTLWGAGYNGNGQLGDGTTTDKASPVKISDGVISVAAGYNHTMFLKDDRTLWGTGNNGYGQLGDGTTTAKASPLKVADGVISVAAGDYHTMFIKADGTLWGAGYKGNGRLGDGTNTDKASPVKISDGVISVAAGTAHTMFIKSDGTLWAVGVNRDGQLGDGTTVDKSSPVKVAGMVASVAAGYNHTMFIKDDGTLWGTGNNGYGQLGDGTSSIYQLWLNKEVLPVEVARSVSCVSAGVYCTLLIKTDGTLWGMGSNGRGELGLGDSGLKQSPNHIFGGINSTPATLAVSTPPVITNQPTAQNVVLGFQINLEVVANGSPAPTYQWRKSGSNIPNATNSSYTISSATIGDAGTYTVVVTNSVGSVTSNEAIVTVNPAAPAAIAVQPTNVTANLGQSAILSVTVSGSPAPAIQWLKNGTAISGATNATYTISSVSQSDAATYTATVQNVYNGTTYSLTTSPAVLTVIAAPIFTTHPASQSVFAGAKVVLSATLQDATATTYQWKKNNSAIEGATVASYVLPLAATTDSGSYSVVATNGAGSSTSNPAEVTVTVATPAAITTQPGSQTVVAGGNVTFSVNATGSEPMLYRWYRNAVRVDSATGPTFTIGNTGTVDAGEYRVELENWPLQTRLVSAGYFHTMLLRSDGSLWGVGRNDNGQLGVGSGVISSPVQVASNVIDVSPSYYHTMMIKADGSLWGTGRNQYGQLGDRTTVQRLTWVKVADGVANVSSGHSHTIFVKTDGSLWAVGQNSSGELGDGSNIDRNSPVKVAEGVVRAYAGYGHSLFLKVDGTLWAMGANGAGQLGDGSTTHRNIPLQVASGVRIVSVGAGHSLFLKENGDLWSVGNNQYGRLGDGSGGNRSTPVKVAERVAKICAAYEHTLFIKQDGTLWSMGRNHVGQLGDGTTINRSLPVLIASGVANVTAGYGHTLFLRIDGTLWGVGENGNGQLLTYSTSNQLQPVGVPTGVLSSPAVLTVSTPPVISGAPANVTIPTGERTQLKVTATGAGTLIYQWYQGQSGSTTNPVNGATGATLTTPALTATTSYWVRVTDSNGVVTNGPTSTVTVSASSPLAVSQTVMGHGYMAGGAVTVTNIITYTGTAPSRIDWSTLLPTGWKFLGSGGSEGGGRPTYKNADLIEWSWTTVPPSPIEFTYTVSVPAGTTDDQVIASLVTSQAAGTNYQTMAKPDPLVIRSASPHTADSNRDGRISLLELTRVIELYNYRAGTVRTGQYKVKVGTEDGFEVGP